MHDSEIMILLPPPCVLGLQVCTTWFMQAEYGTQGFMCARQALCPEVNSQPPDLIITDKRIKCYLFTRVSPCLFFFYFNHLHLLRKVRLFKEAAPSFRVIYMWKKYKIT